MTQLEQIDGWLKKGKRMVFLGGAGVSTASGIPDFRSSTGLGAGLDFETILSHSYFLTHTREFYDFYRSRMLYPQAQPNAVHKKLAAWEAQGRLAAVLTQNIDGLHQKAGSQRVLELHGSVLRNTCTRCGRFFTLEEVLEAETVPRCPCGGLIKPDVVLYEEPLDQAVLEAAVDALMAADMLIVAGTSLRVYPAAGLVQYADHARKILINGEATPLDGCFDTVIHADMIDIFEQLS